MKHNRLQTKIIVATLMCILIIGVFSYSILYRDLAGTVSRRAQLIESISMHSVQSILDNNFELFFQLGNVAANNYTIAKGMLGNQLDTPEAKRRLVAAHETLTNHLFSSGVSQYVDKLMVFNQYGITAQATSIHNDNAMNDYQSVMALPIFQQLEETGVSYLIATSPSIARRQPEDCLAMVCRVEFHGLPSGEGISGQGWLYAELSPRAIRDAIMPYPQSGLFVAQTGHESAPFVKDASLSPAALSLASGDWEDDRLIHQGRSTYRISILPLTRVNLMLYSFADITQFTGDRMEIIMPVLVSALTSAFVVILLSAMLSRFVNRPLKALTTRIQKISGENDFSHDPAIERGNDEIAEVGKVVNTMTASISQLLTETEIMYEQRKDAEIALLQSQVNPHFLYNTLDSIRWMAVIQNAPGIAKTTSSLANLLKNLAKGAGDKIPLSEELSLLADYAETQSVRYMEMFEIINTIDDAFLHYPIVKFTLQPLVENAIFHGIEPMGECGTITLGAYDEEDLLCLTVEDNGVGMTPEELDALMSMSRNPHRSGMAGIGIANVHNRLQLHYGKACGLTYESEKGAYTRVTVRILKEVP